MSRIKFGKNNFYPILEDYNKGNYYMHGATDISAVRISPKRELLKPLVRSSIDNAPLIEAMIVIPCGDRINEELAKKRFGDHLIDGWKVEKGYKCPTCQEYVEGCIQDNLIRKISSIVFTKQDYPGKSSDFIHVKGNWVLSKKNPYLKMKFVSGTKDGFIQNFEIRGYQDGTVNIWIKFNSNNTHQFRNFLKGNGLPVEMNAKEISNGEYTTRNIEELKVLYEIISKNNTFRSAELKNKLYRIVDRGKVPVFGSDTENNFHALFVEELSKKARSESTEAEKVNHIDYPGEKGIFVLEKGDWELLSSTNSICRRMDFKSINTASLFKNFKILGFVNNEVKICIEFNPCSTEVIEKYFNSKGIKLKMDAIDKGLGFYRTENKEETEAIFKEIIENNDFPALLLPKMKAIIEKAEIGQIVEKNNTKDCSSKLTAITYIKII